MAALKVSRLQKRGQVTIPMEIRQRLGLEEGDLVAFIETAAGVVISPQEVVPAEMLAKMESYLQQQGGALDDLLAFAKRVESEARPSTAPVPAEADAVQQTAGIFARSGRRQALDFKAARRQFIDEAAGNVQTEAADSRQ